MRISDWSSDVCSSDLRSWIFDPAMVVEKDIFDNKGNAIARAGQRVNPMDFVTIRQKLVFIDGDDRDQLNWALRRFDDQSAKLIMVKGAPLDAMTQHQRRFYFDQGGFLVDRKRVGEGKSGAGRVRL